MSDPWAFGWDQIAAFLNVVAIGVATWVAWRSVRDWRAERLDARQAEVAEQALILAYQVQEVFPRIRSIVGFSDEGSTRKPEPNESPDEKRQRDNAFVPIERIQKEALFFEQVAEIRPRVDAVFGKGHAKPFHEFLSIRWEIIGAAHNLSGLSRRRYFPTEEEREAHRAEMSKFEAIIWRLPSGEDPLEKRLVDAVAEIETFAGPLLESRLRRSPHA
jgi:hypothetical protein